jgi:hypothetical protein
VCSSDLPEDKAAQVRGGEDWAKSIKNAVGGAVGWATRDQNLGNQVANTNWIQTATTSQGLLSAARVGIGTVAGAVSLRNPMLTNTAMISVDTLGSAVLGTTPQLRLTDTPYVYMQQQTQGLQRLNNDYGAVSIPLYSLGTVTNPILEDLSGITAGSTQAKLSGQKIDRITGGTLSVWTKLGIGKDLGNPYAAQLQGWDRITKQDPWAVAKLALICVSGGYGIAGLTGGIAGTTATSTALTYGQMTLSGAAFDVTYSNTQSMLAGKGLLSVDQNIEAAATGGFYGFMLTKPFGGLVQSKLIDPLSNKLANKLIGSGSSVIDDVAANSLDDLSRAGRQNIDDLAKTGSDVSRFGRLKTLITNAVKAPARDARAIFRLNPSEMFVEDPFTEASQIWRTSESALGKSHAIYKGAMGVGRFVAAEYVPRYGLYAGAGLGTLRYATLSQEQRLDATKVDPISATFVKFPASIHSALLYWTADTDQKLAEAKRLDEWIYGNDSGDKYGLQQTSIAGYIQGTAMNLHKQGGILNEAASGLLNLPATIDGFAHFPYKTVHDVGKYTRLGSNEGGAIGGFVGFWRGGAMNAWGMARFMTSIPEAGINAIGGVDRKSVV